MWTVELLDAEGNVLENVSTTSSGRYTFRGLELGGYQVSLVARSGWVATQEPEEITATRGGTLSGLNYGYARTSGPISGGGAGTASAAGVSPVASATGTDTDNDYDNEDDADESVITSQGP